MGFRRKGRKPRKGTLKTAGLPPKEFWENRKNNLVFALNDNATRIETEVIDATPANEGRLKGGWVLTPATLSNPIAIIEQSVPYFLPVEIGRKPGKGISKEGQKSVKRWAKLVLGIGSDTEQAGFAYLLSKKYKAEGRPAVGFLGLAKEGVVPSSNFSVDQEYNPISGSLLDEAFKRLLSDLDSVE